jgi:hypothetical protein
MIKKPLLSLTAIKPMKVAVCSACYEKGIINHFVSHKKQDPRRRHEQISEHAAKAHETPQDILTILLAVFNPAEKKKIHGTHAPAKKNNPPIADLSDNSTDKEDDIDLEDDIIPDWTKLEEMFLAVKFKEDDPGHNLDERRKALFYIGKWCNKIYTDRQQL